MERATIFFIGKPGSGKGTQAKLLSESTGWPVLASGAQFRAIAGEDSAVGRKIKEEIDQGMLAPHWFAMYLYQRALFCIPESSSVIFDGFNRKVEEAKLIIDSLKWLERPFVVLNIDISDEEVRARLKGRATTSGREDDRQNAVEERLEEFTEYTTKALSMFRDMKVLIDINGAQTRKKVAEDIHQAVMSL